MNYKEIGNYISIKKQEKGLSTDELSKELNVPVKKIKSWEKGRRCPDPDKMKDLCNCLGITLNELLLAKNLDVKEQISEDVVIDIIKENNKIEKAFRITGVLTILAVAILSFIEAHVIKENRVSTVCCSIVLVVSAISIWGSLFFNKRLYKKNQAMM